MATGQDYAAARRLMVDAQVRTNDVTDRRLQAAFLAVPREVFLGKAQRQFAYADTVLEPVSGRFLWRARDLGKLVQSLEPRSTDIALVVGGGAGYAAAVLAKLCETVIVLETNDDLVASATRKFADAGADNVVVVKGDLRAGWAKDAPFNVILVDGAVGAMAQSWSDQLAEGGRLGVVLREGPVGRARLYTRTGGNVGFRTLHDSTAPELAELRAKAGFVF